MSILTFTEQVDIPKLKTILNNRETYPIQSLYDGRKITDYDGVYTLMNKYLNSLDEKGRITISYKQKGGFGRYWPQHIGLTTMCKKVRHTIGNEFNIDLDITNCHPVLLERYCVINGVSIPLLQKYNRNRENYRYLKDDIIIAINNGSNFKHDNDVFFNCLNREIRIVIYPLFREMDEWKQLSDKYPKTTSNIEGKVMANILQDWENMCLQSMIKTAQKMEFTITSLAYDGFTLSKNEKYVEGLDDLIQEMEEVIREDTGFNIKICEKKMDQGWTIPQEEEEEMISLLRLPQQVKSCECLFEHSDMLSLLKSIVDLHSISTMSKEFKEVCIFLKNYSKNNCLYKFVNRLSSSIITDFDVDELISQIPNDLKYDWNWVLTLLPPRKKEFKNVRLFINKRLSELSSEKYTMLESIEDHPFTRENDVFEFVNKYRSMIWDSKEKLIEDFVNNIGRYLKYILLPYCFVMNRGNGKIDITTPIKIFTRYIFYAEGIMRVAQINVVDAFFGDLSVSSRLTIYKNITFQPNPKDVLEGEYNMFPGIEAKLVEEVDLKLIEPILYHMKECWAAGDDNIYDYICHWLRQAFLEPWNKTGIVLLLYGVQGSGKGCLIDEFLIPYVYGTKISCVSQTLTPLTQQFNSICMNKLFIFANEIANGSKGGFHTSFDKLKALITDRTMTIEKKGIDLINDYPNYINFMFATNNKDSVKLGRTDRRYVCLETSSKFKGDWDYFDKLFACFDQTTANHFYTYFYNFKKTRNIRDIPMTQLKEDMMIKGKPHIEFFVEDITRLAKDKNNKQRNPEIYYQKWDDLLLERISKDKELQARTLYEVYKLWCNENKEQLLSNTLFGREIKHLLKIKNKRKGIFYILN